MAETSNSKGWRRRDSSECRMQLPFYQCIFLISYFFSFFSAIHSETFSRIQGEFISDDSLSQLPHSCDTKWTNINFHFHFMFTREIFFFMFFMQILSDWFLECNFFSFYFNFMFAECILIAVRTAGIKINFNIKSCINFVSEIMLYWCSHNFESGKIFWIEFQGFTHIFHFFLISHFSVVSICCDEKSLLISNFLFEDFSSTLME